MNNKYMNAAQAQAGQAGQAGMQAGYAQEMQAGRQHAADVLLDSAGRLERKAAGLRAMAALVPRQGLSPEAEEAIWNVAVNL